MQFGAPPLNSKKLICIIIFFTKLVNSVQTKTDAKLKIYDEMD